MKAFVRSPACRAICPQHHKGGILEAHAMCFIPIGSGGLLHNLTSFLNQRCLFCLLSSTKAPRENLYNGQSTPSLICPNHLWAQFVLPPFHSCSPEPPHIKTDLGFFDLFQHLHHWKALVHAPILRIVRELQGSVQMQAIEARTKRDGMVARENRDHWLYLRCLETTHQWIIKTAWPIRHITFWLYSIDVKIGFGFWGLQPIDWHCSAGVRLWWVSYNQTGRSGVVVHKVQTTWSTEHGLPSR